MKQLKTLCLTLAFFAPILLAAQTTVNVYARVTAINNNTITISNATGSFVAGDAIVMQMQDSTIGNNTTNTSSFGNLASIQSAGLHEIVTITSATATTITLTKNLTNAYHFGVNSRVQIISYPTFGAGGNYTLSTAVTAAAWNGNTGGVVAFKVVGVLTINSNISVDAKGFRGGAVGANAPGDLTCSSDTYYDNAGGVSTTYNGGKGEGIYNSTVYTVARGKILNGAGGGNPNNGGGGGGGNFTAGGDGGLGWSCTLTNTGGGLGGLDLSAQISGTRFFMGGGGGGGQQNNSVGTVGANGGGIIMIKANGIQTNSGCNAGANAVSISANGQTAANSGNDGAGGAGAGGTVLLESPTYSINNGCPLTISSNGGNGGSVNDPGAHGAGGGGGKGVIIFSEYTGTPANTTAKTNTGTGGANSSSSGAVTAGAGSSVATGGGTSIINIPVSVLPVQLYNFTVSVSNKNAVLHWQTGVESKIDYYEIERSVDNSNSFSTIGKVTATGSNSTYSFKNDLSTTNINNAVYYRLKWTEKDGTAVYSDTRAVSFTNEMKKGITAYPNPAISTVNITLGNYNNIKVCDATVLDMQGRILKRYSSLAVPQNGTISVSLNGLTAGNYIIAVNLAGIMEHTVIVKQ
jgi:hypothetical protein